MQARYSIHTSCPTWARCAGNKGINVWRKLYQKEVEAGEGAALGATGLARLLKGLAPKGPVEAGRLDHAINQVRAPLPLPPS